MNVAAAVMRRAAAGLRMSLPDNSLRIRVFPVRRQALHLLTRNGARRATTFSTARVRKKSASFVAEHRDQKHVACFVSRPGRLAFSTAGGASSDSGSDSDSDSDGSSDSSNDSDSDGDDGEVTSQGDLEQKTRKHEKSRSSSSTKSSSKVPTVSEFFHKVYKKKRQHRVSEGTWRREVSYWNRLLRTFGDTPLDELDGIKWDDYLDTLGSGATKRLHQTAYRAMLKMAVHRGLIDKMHSFDRIVGATVHVREIKPFTVEEVPLLLDAAHTPMHRAIFAVGIGQGLRPGEIPLLRWEDIDWTASKMFVRGTKTANATAWIAMSSFTIDELRRFHKLEGYPTSGLLFTWHGKPIKHFKTALHSAGRAAGLLRPDRRIHPNMLRHTFATLAAYFGVPLPTAQAILRHSNVLMLVRVYAKAGRLHSNEGLSNFPV